MEVLMKTRKVIVMPYDKAWESAFEDIKEEIESALGDLIICIEHVGSTSVEGMSAKPCIDLDVVIKDCSVFDTVVAKLAIMGYIHEGDLGIKDREAFKYSNIAPSLCMFERFRGTPSAYYIQRLSAF
jgi:GrpB-like predicted nucleotidyltransferase (UPF0157 family)